VHPGAVTAPPFARCCCFHFDSSHVTDPRPMCIPCSDYGYRSQFPPNHRFVPEPELTPAHPRPKPGDPSYNIYNQRLDRLFDGQEAHQ
jgi:hypothetical protein